jgi:hypothetical protein
MIKCNAKVNDYNNLNVEGVVIILSNQNYFFLNNKPPWV